MRNLYIVETDRGIRAECRVKKCAELQAEEYLNNYWWTVYLYHYIIENQDIEFQVEDWELCFYLDNSPIYEEQRKENWIWRWLLKTIKKPIQELCFNY